MASFLCQIRYNTPTLREHVAEQVTVPDATDPEQELAFAERQFREQINSERKARKSLDRELATKSWCIDCIRL